MSKANFKEQWNSNWSFCPGAGKLYELKEKASTNTLGYTLGKQNKEHMAYIMAFTTSLS